MKHVAILISALLGETLALTATPASCAELDLRVLIVAVGDSAADSARAVAEQMLDRLGVPYEVLDSSRQDLSAALLVSGARGRFNGILLTDAETYLSGGRTGFDSGMCQSV